MVLTLSGDQIAAMTSFDNNVLARFGLPRTLPAVPRQPPDRFGV
jgi:hypothetical protein